MISQALNFNKNCLISKSVIQVTLFYYLLYYDVYSFTTLRVLDMFAFVVIVQIILVIAGFAVCEKQYRSDYGVFVVFVFLVEILVSIFNQGQIS